MQMIVLVAGVFFAATIMLLPGCAPTAAKPPIIPVSGQIITGEVCPLDLTIPNDTEYIPFTVETNQGKQTVLLSSNTTYFLDGKACTIEDIGKALEQEGTTYNCTIVVEPCEPGIVAKWLAVFTNKK